MAFFTHELGEGFDLALRDLRTVDGMLALTQANIERLRAWEPWAQGEQTRAGLVAYTNSLMTEWVAGRSLPTVVRSDGELIGSITCRISRPARAAELGYWIDGRFEGRGVVAQGCRAIIGELAEEGVRRVEIRTAEGNERSRRVAERLGFRHEETRRRAFPVGSVRHDLVVYALDIGAAGFGAAG